MKLNIIGFKNMEDNQLEILTLNLDEATSKLGYSDEVAVALRNLSYDIRGEINRRNRSNSVWVEFVGEWSGYESRQRKEVGRFYRKLHRSTADSLSSYYRKDFTDNTWNDWYVKKVSVRGKDSGSYSAQVDEIISSIL